jgi:CDP-diacylglycerol--glycerol-3-phosphate 3-phosphatidyltransferase
MKSNLFLLPNLITISRLLCIPLILFFYLSGIDNLKILSFIIFLYASISDFIDGYLARKLNQITLIGKILDPIADKLLVILTFMLFLTENFINIFTITGILIITAREIIIMTIREIFAHQNIQIDVIGLSKIKTTIQFIALILLFITSLFASEVIILLLLTNTAILLGALISVVTLFLYIRNIYLILNKATKK